MQLCLFVPLLRLNLQKYLKLNEASFVKIFFLKLIHISLYQNTRNKTLFCQYIHEKVSPKGKMHRPGIEPGPPALCKFAVGRREFYH